MEPGKMKVAKINITLSGLADIMFDKFVGQGPDPGIPEQKLYMVENNQVVLPSENIYAFLLSENPAGCAKAFEGKKGKEYIRMGQGHLTVSPDMIPFTQDNKQVVFKEFGETFYVSQYAPRVKSGSLSIKQNIRLRPVLRLPWELSFQITLFDNKLIDDNRLHNWFDRGGIEIALGTYRPRFGRFMVKEFKTE